MWEPLKKDRFIVDYCVITEELLVYLEERVKDAIEKGWQPHGPLIHSSDMALGDYAQAMVKYKGIMFSEETLQRG